MTAIHVRGKPVVTSGADGWVRLALDWPMELTYGNNSWAFVEVTGEGLTRVQRQESSRGPGEVQLGEIRLAEAGAITGRILDHDGTPVSWARAWLVQGVEPGDPTVEDLRRSGAGGFTGISVGFHAAPGEDGRYSIEGVPLARVSVVGMAPERCRAYTTPVQIRKGVTVNAPDLILELPGKENLIRGRVLDEAGDPLIGAGVWVWENHGPRNVNPKSTAPTSRPDGRFQLMVPANQLFTLEARNRENGRFLLAHDVASGSQEVVLAFPPERTLEIHVTDREGNAVETPHAGLSDESGYGMSIRPEQLGEGKLSLDLPTVPFQLWVGADGYQGRQFGPLDPEEIRGPMDVQLDHAGVLSGRVVAGGEPIAGARVHCHVPPRRSRFLRFAGELYTRLGGQESLRGGARTDESGHFEIPVQRADTYYLHAEAAGFAQAEAEVVTRAPDESVSGIVLTLQRPATLEGRVLVSPGVELEEILVAATRGDGHARLQATDEQGGYRFEGLAPGGWQLARCVPDDRRWIESERTWPESGIDELPVHVVLTAGGTSRYDLDLTHEFQALLRGRLTLGGSPAAAWHLWMRDEAGAQVRTDLDDQGRFQTQLVTSGPAWMVLTSPALAGGALTLRTPVTQVAGDNEWNLDVATGDLQLDGLPPAVDLGAQSFMRTYELRWETGEDGTQCRFAFEPDPTGSLDAVGLPAGTVTLVRREPSERGYPGENEVQHFTIVAGSSTALTYREE